MYKCKYFAIHELVPPKVFDERGEKAWELIDDRLLITLDRLRERYGSITINNYVWGKDRQWSGLRTPDSPYFSPYSQHTFGRAADCIFADVTAEQVRQDMLNNIDDPLFEFVRSIELSVSWLHFDIRNCTRIKAFKP